MFAVPGHAVGYASVTDRVWYGAQLDLNCMLRRASVAERCDDQQVGMVRHTPGYGPAMNRMCRAIPVPVGKSPWLCVRAVVGERGGARVWGGKV